jgi:hypothetical protein
MVFFCSVVAIAKREHDYIAEFVAYYKLILQVDHIYLYDNDPDNPLSAAIPSEFASSCTVIPFPGVGMQKLAYSNYIAHHSTKSVWAIIVDIDEFLVLYKHSTIKQFLSLVRPRVKMLGVNWMMFSFCDHETKPEGWVIENYTRGVFNVHIKTIARTSRLRELYNAHKKDIVCIHNLFHSCQRLDGTFIGRTAFNKRREDSRFIALFHYWTKSEEEFRSKLERGRADSSKRNVEGSMREAKQIDSTATCQCFMVEHIVPRLEEALGMNKKEAPLAVSTESE